MIVKVDGSTSGTNPDTDPEIFQQRATRLVTSPDAGTLLSVETPDGRLYSVSRAGRWRPSDIAPGLRAPTFVG